MSPLRSVLMRLVDGLRVFVGLTAAAHRKVERFGLDSLAWRRAADEPAKVVAEDAFHPLWQRPLACSLQPLSTCRLLMVTLWAWWLRTRCPQHHHPLAALSGLALHSQRLVQQRAAHTHVRHEPGRSGYCVLALPLCHVACRRPCRWSCPPPHSCLPLGCRALPAIRTQATRRARERRPRS